MWKQCLEIDPHPLGIGHVHYVGDYVPRTDESAHHAGEEQSTRAGGFPTLEDDAV